MKRLPRFSLRAFLVALTLLAIFGGGELYQQSRQARNVSALRLLPGTLIAFGYELEELPNWKGKTPFVRSTLGGLVRCAFGSDFFHAAVHLRLEYDPENPTDISRIQGLPHLQWLHIAPGGTEAKRGLVCPSLDALSKCENLEFLVLGIWLAKPTARSLGLMDCPTTLLPLNVDSSHLAALHKLKCLRVLALGGPGLSDDSIDELAMFKQLEFLYRLIFQSSIVHGL